MMCSVQWALTWLILALALSAAIGWVIRIGRIWGGRGSGMLVVERSDYPFTYWTQVAVLATIDLVLYLLVWRSIQPCFSN